MTVACVLFGISVFTAFAASICAVGAMLYKSVYMPVEICCRKIDANKTKIRTNRKVEDNGNLQLQIRTASNRRRIEAIENILTVEIEGEGYTIGKNISDMLREFKIAEECQGKYLQPYQFDAVSVCDSCGNQYKLGVYNRSLSALLLKDCEVYAVAIARDELKDVDALRFKAGFSFGDKIDNVIVALGMPDNIAENGPSYVYGWCEDNFEYEVQVVANKETGEIESVKMM